MQQNHRHNLTQSTAMDKSSLCIAICYYERQAKLARDTGWTARAEMMQTRANELRLGWNEQELREAIAGIRAREKRVFA